MSELGKERQGSREPEPRYVSGGDQWAKLACGCYAEWDGYEWIVAAVSFLCDHRQGDHADGAAPGSDLPRDSSQFDERASQIPGRVSGHKPSAPDRKELR